MKARNHSKGAAGIGIALLILALIGAFYAASIRPIAADELPTFSSCTEMAQTFETARQQGYGSWGINERSLGMPMMATTDVASGAAEGSAPSANQGTDYSTTNIQVAGVDEADIVKTDGTYIYTLSTVERYYGYYEDVADDDSDEGSILVIAKAHPAVDAEIVSQTRLGTFNPSEMFIEGDRLLIFGYTYEEIPMPEPRVAGAPAASGASVDMIYPYPYRTTLTTAVIYDISDCSDPEKVRTVDFEGSYLTSRKIGSDVYFVMNSYPRWDILPAEGGFITPEAVNSLIPVYRDSAEVTLLAGDEPEFEPACGCEDVGYFDPIQAERFVTLASIPMDDDDGEIVKEVIMGSGENVYASLENLYVAESIWPYWGMRTLEASDGGDVSEPTQRTVIHKFNLDNGAISYQGNGEVPGYILNQFSMDEHNDYFRIATTVGRQSRSGSTTSNNVYILDSGLERAGEIEDIAPGESIYSARFLGDRGYLVTFKKIDPFFVIDLSDPNNPRILGKLKIPGYSDYLHPYDDNHIIGIGKDTVEAEESFGDFAWYQGVKMAVFDVTDVSNPVELHKVIIGDRGTNSEALYDHKAFLFDRGKNLLVLPITLAEIPDSVKEGARSNQHGDFVYQGAYVYDLTLENGFDLKGRVTHYDNDDAFKKSGYYWGDQGYNVRRSLYIGNVLYTVSNSMIKANLLSDLAEVNELSF
jgi:uncharacterized secreted protein with C-terminal beta-propeller domain